MAQVDVEPVLAHRHARHDSWTTRACSAGISAFQRSSNCVSAAVTVLSSRPLSFSARVPSAR